MFSNFIAAYELSQKNGQLAPGKGLATGVLYLNLSILCFLGVFCFYFPEYLTTPEFRKSYNVDIVRNIMLGGLIIAGFGSALNIILNRSRKINFVSFTLVVITCLLGGNAVPVGDFPDDTIYVGLDWFILTLLGSVLIFSTLEKVLPLRREQAIFRPDWQTDLVYYGINHLLIGAFLLIVNFIVFNLLKPIYFPPLHNLIQQIHFIPQLFLCVLAADLAEYWLHRAYHKVPRLWKIHSVHHSSEHMDWLAGSRLHFLEIIMTRVAVLGTLYFFGFSKQVIDGYILIVGFQAVFIHANSKLPFGFLRYIFVTPAFHHWHHTSEKEGIDKNFAAHFSFIDYLFGTAVKSDRVFPEKYGVVGNTVPQGYWAQLKHPLKRKKKKVKVEVENSKKN